MSCFFATTWQAAHTPSASNATVSFRVSMLCLYSRSEFGFWLE